MSSTSYIICVVKKKKKNVLLLISPLSPSTVTLSISSAYLLTRTDSRRDLHARKSARRIERPINRRDRCVRCILICVGGGGLNYRQIQFSTREIVFFFLLLHLCHYFPRSDARIHVPRASTRRRRK